MTATKEQKRLIAINTPNKAIKEEWVQWATGDVRKTSTNDLSFEQANLILTQLGLKPHVVISWAKFDKNNPKHLRILSIMRQANWTIKSEKGKELPDLNRLNSFLQSSKCPVNKPLLEMNNDTEIPKVIKALEGVARSVWK